MKIECAGSPLRSPAGLPDIGVIDVCNEAHGYGTIGALQFMSTMATQKNTSRKCY